MTSSSNQALQKEVPSKFSNGKSDKSDIKNRNSFGVDKQYAKMKRGYKPSKYTCENESTEETMSALDYFRNKCQLKLKRLHDDREDIRQKHIDDRLYKIKKMKLMTIHLDLLKDLSEIMSRRT